MNKIELVRKFKDLISRQQEELDIAKIDLHFEQYYSTNQDKKIEEYDDLVEKGKKSSEDALYYVDNILWLLERFPKGKYQDVIGLCKVAKLDEEDGIKDQDYSLNAGRYVGVVIEDDGMTENEFKREMITINNEFIKLTKKSEILSNEIQDNLKGLVGE